MLHVDCYVIPARLRLCHMAKLTSHLIFKAGISKQARSAKRFRKHYLLEVVSDVACKQPGSSDRPLSVWLKDLQSAFPAAP